MMLMRIVRTAAYLRAVRKLGASEAEIATLEEAVAADPEAGAGVRKVRFALCEHDKSGGGSAIHHVMIAEDAAVMITGPCQLGKGEPHTNRPQGDPSTD
jgi:hypothetical protein